MRLFLGLVCTLLVAPVLWCSSIISSYPTDGNGGLTLAEASAMKLYSARAATEVAMEAVQLFGGNGYMAEFQVEQLARDAKVLQIYAGTDEIQITHIAKDLLRR
jgi:alkylation response protein AidB-like acyl-CoA dehydrogenase